MYSPLEIFTITTYYTLQNKWIDLSINIVTIYLILILLFLITLYKLTYTNKLISNRFYYVIRNFIYFFNKEIINALNLKANRYFGLVTTIFIFILFNNLIGLIPYSFTNTSQLIFCLSLSLTIWIGATLIGIFTHGYKFINLFLPSGVPIFILPLIFIIEIVVYFSRIVSLALRLVGNMVAGHSLLTIISGLGFSLSIINICIFIIPILIAFFFLEFGVAIIQALVFTLLTSFYIKDAVVLH